MSRHAAEHLLRLLLPAVARPVLLFLETPPQGLVLVWHKAMLSARLGLNSRLNQ